MERNKQRIAQKLGETPKKPLNVDENENEKEKENDDVEYIQSPVAMEPTRGSGGTIGSSSSLIQDRDSGPGLSVSFAMEDAPWIRQLVEEMSQTELIERYEHAIDKIALSKVESRELNSEGALAVEAAEGLDGEAFKECVLKLRDYALYGEEVSSKDPVVNIILMMAKPNIKAATSRYKKAVENGELGKEHG